APGAETEKAVHPGAAQSRQGRTAEETAAAGKNTGIGGVTMQFTVEEENLICMYHKSDRRRTAANIRATLPDMDEGMAALARRTADKLDTMNDADFEAQQFHFTGE